MPYRFQVVNIARPREPRLVGSCVMPDYAWDMGIEGNLAAVAHILSLQFVDITRPDSPRVIGTWGGDVNCVDIVDTIAFAAGPYTGLIALSLANPAGPYVLDSLPLTDTLWWNDVVVIDSVAYVGGEVIQPVDVSDPRNLRVMGEGWVPPYLVRRLCYSQPYLYAACYEAGVCVLETVQVGVKESQGTRHQEKVSVVPSITSGVAWVSIDGGPGGVEIGEVYNATGIKLKEITERNEPGWKYIKVDLSKDPAGVYIVRLRAQNKNYSSRVVKTKGR